MTQLPSQRPIDPAFIAAVARTVVERLRGGELDASAESPERLITIETLGKYPDAGLVTAAHRAVVTPAAKEEAKRRGITIASAAAPIVSVATETETIHEDPLTGQLAQRGIALPSGTDVVWTDTPAIELVQRCKSGRVAVMISRLSDVARFSQELSPNCWILDKQHLNLTAAANVVARIVQASQLSMGATK